MSKLSDLSKQPTIRVDELLTAKNSASGTTEYAEIDMLLAQISELSGIFFAEDLAIIRHDTFDAYYAADFAAWAEEEGDYSVGKELMDAEAAYLDWLRILCAKLLVNGVLFYLNHKLRLPEDWFYRRSAWQ